MKKTKSKYSLFSSKNKIYYDKESDALWLILKKGQEEEYKEIAPGVGLELGKNGEVLGIEILNASKVLGKRIFGKTVPVSPLG